MRWIAAALLVAVMGSPAVLAQAASTLASAPATAQSEPAPQTRVVHLKVRAVGEPVPALKYQLLTPAPEQIHGDAMTLYYIIMEKVARIRESHKDFGDKVNTWLTETPAADLPKDEVRTVLKEFDEIWPMLDLATRQRTCEWNLQVERLGYDANLPALSLWQYMARLTALRARLAIAEGRYDDALQSLRMGYDMARHVSGGPTNIMEVVGIALAAIQTRQLEDLVAADGGPSLYWAMATLPQPFVDVRPGWQFEMSVLYYTFPELREVRAGTLTPQQWETLADKISRHMQRLFAGHEEVPTIAKEGFPTTVLPDAREYWRSRGLTDKQIDAMPVNQTNLTYGLDMHDQYWGEIAKWFSLPYWQGQAGLQRTENRLREALRSGKAELFTWFVPTLNRFYALQANLQQQLAAVQTIEAIRLHAAAHGGRLPATLDEITESPVPVTPVTGKYIEYKVKGNTFELNTQGAGGGEGVRYIVTVTK